MRGSHTRPPHPRARSGVEGFANANWTLVKVADGASSVRPTDTDGRTQRRCWRVTTEARETLWLTLVGSPVDAAGPSPPSAKPRLDSGSVGFRRPGSSFTSKRQSSISSSRRAQILFRCAFCSSLAK